MTKVRGLKVAWRELVSKRIGTSQVYKPDDYSQIFSTKSECRRTPLSPLEKHFALEAEKCLPCLVTLGGKWFKTTWKARGPSINKATSSIWSRSANPGSGAVPYHSSQIRRRLYGADRPLLKEECAGRTSLANIAGEFKGQKRLPIHPYLAQGLLIASLWNVNVLLGRSILQHAAP